MHWLSSYHHRSQFFDSLTQTGARKLERCTSLVTDQQPSAILYRYSLLRLTVTGQVQTFAVSAVVILSVLCSSTRLYMSMLLHCQTKMSNFIFKCNAALVFLGFSMSALGRLMEFVTANC